MDLSKKKKTKARAVIPRRNTIHAPTPTQTTIFNTRYCMYQTCQFSRLKKLNLLGSTGMLCDSVFASPKIVKAEHIAIRTKKEKKLFQKRSQRKHLTYFKDRAVPLNFLLDSPGLKNNI